MCAWAAQVVTSTCSATATRRPCATAKRPGASARAMTGRMVLRGMGGVSLCVGMDEDYYPK